jgi:cytidylate kinase
MPQPSLIAIDGAAGTGKSTLGALLAQRLGYLYFDTGVMYRAVTLVAVQQKLDCTDSTRMENLAHEVAIDVVPPTMEDGRQYTVLVNGTDVTWDIRSPNVEQHVSLVSRHPGVRAELIRQQRLIGQRGKVVMVGRDIGTVVMPDAPLKIYLTTSLEERARRRYAEAQAKPDSASPSLEHIQADLARRDKLDSHVLQPARDALLLQTDTLSPAASADWVIAQFAAREHKSLSVAWD